MTARRPITRRQFGKLGKKPVFVSKSFPRWGAAGAAYGRRGPRYLLARKGLRRPGDINAIRPNSTAPRVAFAPMAN